MAVQISAEQIKHAQKALRGITKGAETASMRALNRAMTAGKTVASRSASRTYEVKMAEVRKTISTSKATKGNLTANVVSRGKRIPLSEFKTKPRKPAFGQGKPFAVSVRKDTGFKQIKGAFLNRDSSTGRLEVFRRVGQARYPIHTQYGPSVPTMLGGQTVREAVEDRANEVLADRLNHEIGRMLSRGRA